MNIVTLLMLVVLGLGIAFAVVMFQVIILARIYRSWAWWVGAGTFVLLASRQIYGLVTLPSSLVQAQMKGTMIERLTWDQWLLVLWAYAIVAGFIWFFDWLRRDLKKLGV